MKIDEKRPRGRPEVAEQDKRSETMQFRVTESEAKLIDNAARSAGMPRSKWLRRQALKK